jgi:hypothetical protein
VKKAFTLVVLVGAAFLMALFLRGHRNTADSRQISGRQISPRRGDTNEVTRIGRLGELEKAGEIPEGDNDILDWQLAQKTSWLGKPLDPKKFWNGRIVWNDRTAVSDAHRHGRLYPPIPYENTNLPAYPNDDGFHTRSAIEGPGIFYADSSKEAGFWDFFNRTKLRPPDQIDQTQFRAAEALLRLGDNGNIRSGPVSANYPPDAFTTNALFWAYVESKRAEYQGLLASYDGTNDPHFAPLFGMLLVDRKYVTDPLTPEQIIAETAAKAWRIAYVNSLAGQNVDPSYINAYLQAWNLTADQVFGPGN